MGDPVEWVPAAPGNYHPGRFGNPVTLIIDHWMAGTETGARARFQNPDSLVSAHYGVTQDGHLIQYVSEDDTAYHAGDFTVNVLSIGIEHEASPTAPPTDALYTASARLHREIAERYEIALHIGTTVKPHRAIVPTECPGTLDLERIVEEAMAEYVTREEFTAYQTDVRNALEAMKALETKTVLILREVRAALTALG